MNEEFARIVAFENVTRDRCATRIEPYAWGTALFNADLPRIFDLNYLRADADLDGVTAATLGAEADRLLGGAGLAHRQIDVADRMHADRLGLGFAAAGYGASRSVFMVLHREPDRRPERTATEVSWAEVEPVHEAELRSHPDLFPDEEVIDQVLGLRAVLNDRWRPRHLGGRTEEGSVVSSADLYTFGGIAQVEDVATLADHRNEGFARAVVQAAVDIALAEGNDLVFIVADDDDWPKALYARLGFDAVGVVTTFRRLP